VQNRGPTRAGLLLQNLIEIAATIPSLLGHESTAALKINNVLVSNVRIKITLLEGDGYGLGAIKSSEYLYGGECLTVSMACTKALLQINF